MALTKIKLNTMVTGTLPDANIPDDITIDTAAAVPASGLTGNTLASGVTASSLTSVGTLGSLTVSGVASLGNNSKVTSSSADTTFKIETTSGTTIFPVLDFVSSHSSVGAKIRQDGSDVITIDNDQDVTFADDITVSGNATFAGDITISNSIPLIYMNDTSGADNNQIIFQAGGSNIFRIGTDITTNNGTSTFEMTNGDGNDARLKITSDGKFGFGNITPAQKYEFRGDNHNDILRMYDSANSDNIWILRNEVHSGTSSGRLQLLKGDGDGVELNGHDGRTSFIKSPLAIGGTTASEKLHIHDGDILVDSGRGVRANGGQEMIRFNSSNGVLINSGNAERIRFTRDGSIKHRDGIGAEMYKSGTTSSNGLAVSFDINLNSPSTLWTSVVVELLITTIGNSHPTASSLYLVEIEHHSTGGMTIATPVYIGGTGSQSISTSNPSTNVAQIRINGQGGSTSNVGAYCRVVSGVTGVSSIT